VPAAESKISYIDGKRGILAYRGYAIQDLAEHSTFEETAFLLIKGHLPNRAELTKFSEDLRVHRRLKFKIVSILKLMPENGHPMDALASAISAMAMFYPAQMVEDVDTRYEAMVRIIAKLPTIVAAYQRIRRGDEPIMPRDDLSHAANFLYMLNEKRHDPAVARIFDKCLIIHAEHAINASTFAARLTGSTLVNAYAVIASAVNTLAGPLHGAANEQVLSALKQIGAPGRAKPVVEEHLRNREIVPGFGHRAYKVRDPRTALLQKLIVELCERTGRSNLYEVALEVEKVAEQHLGPKGVHANVDFYNGILYDRLGIPADLFPCLFAMSRVTGWLAHWHEQLQRNVLYRPSQIFVGDKEKSYLPLDNRS
jgi:citrate synthase